MANEFIARKGLIALSDSQISGSLAINGSGSTLLEVNGSEGQLFSITDSLSGSLFAVSDVSGLPILEVFSDDTVKIGTFNNEAITVNGSSTIIKTLNVTSSLTASGLIYPSTDGLDRQVLKTDGLGNLSFGYAENTQITVKNVSGGSISKGTPCYITASGGSGNIAGIVPADAGNLATMPAGIIAGETIADEAEGVGLVNGFIQGVDTSTFSSGDTVYVAVGGGYTNIKPTGSGVYIQKLGNVEKVDATNGSGVINGPGYYNDLPNWEEGKIVVGTATYPATSSFINIDETNSTLIVDGTISGSGGAQLNLTTYNFGYELLTSFPITGSGLVVSSSNLPADHYNMVKIGETELLNINSLVTPNTFLIHNVDTIVVASGSEPIDIYNGLNKLFEHDGNDFKAYAKGGLKLTISSGSSTFTTPLAAQQIQTAATLASSPQYIAVWEGSPSGVPTVLRYTPISTFVTSGSNAEVASVLIKSTPSASAGSYGAGSRVLSNFTSSMSLTAGDIYFWSSSAEWGVANATTDTTSKGLLAVAATTGGEEMVAEGIVYIGTTISGFTNGNPVYLSTTNGEIIETPPSGSGEIVRAVGYVHSTSQNTIYFNPSNDYFEVE